MVELVDASGNLIATYSYDAWGNLTSSSESFASNPNGWTNLYRYDGRDGARYDASDGLYWLSVRAYDPSLGRFLSRDPLGRAPLFTSDNPYVYAGNNPLSNVDPSGQRAAGASAAQARNAASHSAGETRMTTRAGDPCANPQSPQCRKIKYAAWAQDAIGRRGASSFMQHLWNESGWLIVGGLLIVALVDILEIVSPSAGVASRLSAIIDLAVTFSSVLTAVPSIAAHYALAADIAKIAHYLVGAARFALGELAQFGVFAQAAADVAVDTATAAVSGWASILSTAVQVLLGFAFRNFVSMGGHFLLAAGFAELSVYWQNDSENIDQWCGQHAGVCPSKASYGL